MGARGGPQRPGDARLSPNRSTTAIIARVSTGCPSSPGTRPTSPDERSSFARRGRQQPLLRLLWRGLFQHARSAQTRLPVLRSLAPLTGSLVRGRRRARPSPSDRRSARARSRCAAGRQTARVFDQPPRHAVPRRLGHRSRGRARCPAGAVPDAGLPARADSSLLPRRHEDRRERVAGRRLSRPVDCRCW